jgi:membrane fusion protein
MFRPEAIDAQRDRSLGNILLTQPVSTKWFVLLAVLTVSALLTFAFTFSYTARVTVDGIVVAGRGAIKVYAPQGGLISLSRVAEGQKIARGDVLFELTDERRSSTMGDTHASISEDMRFKLLTLEDEVSKLRSMKMLEVTSIDKKRTELKVELNAIAQLITNQLARLDLAKSDLDRYQSILTNGYVTADQVADRQANVLDQESKLQALRREETSTKRELLDSEYQANTLAIKYDNQIGDVQRGIASARQELTENEVRREFLVVAPSDGVATAVTGHTGQVVDTSRPLVAILPSGVPLGVELYAPSKAIGFIRAGDIVNLRYNAFHYQKFGQFRGMVNEVARTSLTGEELTGNPRVGNNQNGSEEPMYRIAVELAQQEIMAYGKPAPIQSGMTLEADILLESRRLYEWVIDPVLATAKKL